MNTGLNAETDFDYLLSFMPQGWQGKAKELGALSRCRKIPDAETLLRVLLIHLAEGCSLRETAARAEAGGIVKISDVAIMDRLRVAGKWFEWTSRELMQQWVRHQPEVVLGSQRRIRLVDGTRVKEPDPTGSSWCVHYSITLPDLQCCEMQVHDKHGNGETFKRFKVKKDDLFVGDRAYGTSPGIAHVLQRQGEVLTRFGWRHLPLWSKPGRRFDLFRHLRSLSGTRIGDWPVQIQHERKFYQGRVCALKKSRQATEKAEAAVRQKAQKNGNKLQAKTLEAAGYVMVFTTLKKQEMSKTRVLEMYRGRWQIELVFKRLKSLLGFGHLRKTDPESARSWIQGKILVAFLMEVLIRKGESFFPWGYPITESEKQVPVA